MNEKILRQGLLQAWGGKYSPEKTGAFFGLVKSLRWTSDKLIVVNDFILRTPLALPLMLPKIKTRELSDQLIHKVLLEGLDKHIEEVRLAMKVPSRLEAYSTFRRLYAPVILGSVVTIMSIIGYMQAQQAADEMIRQQLQKLDDLRDFVNKIDATKEDILQKAISGAEAEFIEKWGEPPTPEEAIKLRNKIINGIKNQN